MEVDGERWLWKYLGPVLLTIVLALAPVLFYVFQNMVLWPALEKRLDLFTSRLDAIRRDVNQLDDERSQWRAIEIQLKIIEQQNADMRQFVLGILKTPPPEP